MIKEKPKLEFTDESLAEIVRTLVDENTLVIADSYNFKSVKDLGKSILVRTNDHKEIERIRESNDYSKVIAIGGCTALDVGRACAKNDIIAIPTILSTSCLSIDQSVISYNGEHKAVKTMAPSRTIVSIPLLLETDSKENIMWCQSGFGDLFSKISASIDLQYYLKDLSFEKVRENIPEIFEALEWVVSSFDGYTEDSLIRLAIYLHNASIMPIEKGNTRLNAAGEHKLYYKMIHQQKQYTRKRPTHGQLVAIGTLISARIFAEQTGDNRIYEKLSKAYQILGLPLSYGELDKIGVGKDHIAAGLNEISQTKTYLGEYFTKYDYNILDRVFETSRNEASKILGEIKSEIKDYGNLIYQICSQIRDYYEKIPKIEDMPNKLIIGCSGGIDSSVVASLAVLSISSENVITVNIPYYKTDEAILRAEKLAKLLKTEHYTIPITAVVDSEIETINRLDNSKLYLDPSEDKIRFGNFASRARVAVLYDLAKKLNGRVLGTGNRTEFVQGYAAKWGTPTSFDFGVLDELYKTDIYELAKSLKLPEEIINAIPSTGYFRGQSHEEELGATLDEQDIAAYLLFQKGITPSWASKKYHFSIDLLEAVKARHDSSMHKLLSHQPHVKVRNLED